MILSCDCKSDRKGNDQSTQYQDTKYGPGKRVHNPAVGPNNIMSDLPKFRAVENERK